MKTIIVAAALIAREGRILVTQRKEGDDRGLLWEFPGGKVEEGEEPRQALERELREVSSEGMAEQYSMRPSTFQSIPSFFWSIIARSKEASPDPWGAVIFVGRVSMS
jgi:mutator protein MutT